MSLGRAARFVCYLPFAQFLFGRCKLVPADFPSGLCLPSENRLSLADIWWFEPVFSLQRLKFIKRASIALASAHILATSSFTARCAWRWSGQIQP